jgi:hypothetical protein
MTARLGLIVTDASPLITLGAAGALDCLLLPGVPVFIPDMVYTEVRTTWRGWELVRLPCGFGRMKR